MKRLQRIALTFLLVIATPLLAEESATTASLSATFYKKLTNAQAAIDKQDRKQSIAILQALSKQKNNSDYENGIAWNMLGYVHYLNGDLDQSARAYEKALQFDIPQTLRQDSRKILGQIYLTKGNYKPALIVLEQWLDEASVDTAEVHVWAAQCRYQLGQYQQAAAHVKKAIQLAQADNQAPKESWLSLLQASLAQLDEAQSRIDTIKMLLRWYPKSEYWLALAGSFAQLDQMDNYLATLSVAERKQLLNTEAQYLSLATLYYSQQVPYRAAQIIEQGMRKKIINPNVKNLRFLATCYTVAQEFEKAIPPLRQAATQSNDGEIDALLGNALYQLARWQEAADSIATALNKGKNKQTETLLLMLGQTYLNLHQFDNAIEAFKQVLSSETRAHQAEQWIKYTQSERDRYQELGLIKDSAL